MAADGLLTAADVTGITATVLSSLDQSLSLYRPTTANDNYGHVTLTYPGSPTHTITCTVAKPNASELVSYANIIASKRAITIRVMSGTDILENDRLVYDSLNWVIQAKMNANSYSVTMSYIATVVV